MKSEDEYPQYLLTKIPVIPELRDFFAGCALICHGKGLIEAGNAEWQGSGYENAADDAFEMADAMLKAREDEHAD